MVHKSVSDFDDETVEQVQDAKPELVRNAEAHGLRSVRTVVYREDGGDVAVPALRVESQHDSFYVSASRHLQEHGLVMATAFVTVGGKLCALFAHPDALDAAREEAGDE